MALRLRDNLAFCLCGGRAVFLDLEADRYFCLPPVADRAFRALLAGGEADVGALAPLIGRGLLLGNEGPGLEYEQSATVPAASRASGIDDGRRPSWRMIVEALIAQHAAAGRLRRRRLLDLVAGIRARAERLGNPPAEVERAAANVAAAFASSALWLGRHDRCLPRSLALLAMCHRRRIPASLLFGVGAEPFAAHSWVQLGDAVLTGDLEQVQQFTPILVVP
ncbi:lasso peptide biosynthesis B2 protein [Sphingosinicella sp. BN140058]|uniref:lasso peptide biosynthesis B2 protein n=1 Tax=Sphingosinicella sp. BN140058 TaxID=1892855 RepID=UPI001011BE1C|nr:lasso peptide biosynthesis B2 protein [Sphingosinicella sp. BN140058]QAY78186.1 lasso peptide biosynthesis B2 protein [Sphingosinicella sp. BN140058]